MNYKLKLTMPNGEFVETKLMSNDDALKIIDIASDASKNNSGFYLECDGFKRFVNRGAFTNCYLDVVEVDEPTEQPQPSEQKELFGKQFKDMVDAIYGEQPNQCTNFGLSDNPSQPTEQTNVGKRVYFKFGWESRNGVIINETNNTYDIQCDDVSVNILKSCCTILEDQPTSNVGRAVRFPQCDESRIGTIAIQSDEQYVIKYGDGYAVRAKDQCELLPE
jgi:hypothetical protein